MKVVEVCSGANYVVIVINLQDLYLGPLNFTESPSGGGEE
jgi:hypothetical protein